MAKYDVTIRLSTEGRDQLLADLRKLGDQGEKMAKQIERAGQPASRGLLAINAASKEMQSGLQGAASRGGALGGVLSSIGPAGLAAAAGLGVFAASVGFAFKKAKEGMDFADEIDTAVKRLGMGVEALQEYRAALQVAGDASANFDDGARTLLERMGETARGRGQGGAIFAKLGIDIRNAAGEMKSLEEMLPQIADGMAALGSEAERADVANKLFGGQGQNFVAMLGQGSDALARQREEMRAMGLVMDEQVVKRYAEASDKSEMLSKAIDIQLKSAFVDLAPTIVRTLSLFADIASAINRITDAITDLENKTDDGLERERVTAEAEIARLMKIREGLGEASTLHLAFGASPEMGPAGLLDAGAAGIDRQIAEQKEKLEQITAAQIARASWPVTRGEVGSGGGTLTANAQRDAQLLADLTRQIEIFGDARQQAIDNVMKRLSADASPEVRAEIEALAGSIYDMTAAQKAQSEAFQKRDKEIAEGEALRQSLLDDTERLAEETGKLNEMMASGAIASETYDRALRKLQESYDPSIRATKELSGELARIVTSNLATARSFDDLASIAEQALNRILNKILEVHALQPLENFFSGAISSLMPGIFHAGGMAGEAGPSRAVSPALFLGAPRYHMGGLLPGETPIIARQGEGIFTPRQMDNADSLFRALAGMAAGGQQGAVTVNIYRSGGEEAETRQRRNAGGGIDVDVLFRGMDDWLGDNIAGGRSRAGDAIEQRFALDHTRGLVR